MNKVEKFWDSTAKYQDKDSKRFQEIQERVLDHTKKHLKSGDVVLDFGCGTGSKACALAGQVREIHGIDISSKVIEMARQKAAERNITNVHFSRALISDKKLKRESFDVILAFNILHALEDPKRAVQRVYELLKSGGLFISVTPCLGEKMSPWIKIQFTIYLVLSRIGIIPFLSEQFKPSDIDILIGKGRFKILETENIYGGLSAYFMAAQKK